MPAKALVTPDSAPIPQRPSLNAHPSTRCTLHPAPCTLALPPICTRLRPRSFCNLRCDSAAHKSKTPYGFHRTAFYVLVYAVQLAAGAPTVNS
jgi:hypothetical protein